MSMYKIGDLIRGTEKNVYSVTGRGVVCEVVAVDLVAPVGSIQVVPVDGNYRGQRYWVQARYFELETADGGEEYGL